MDNMFKLTSSVPPKPEETEEQKKARKEAELRAYARSAVKLHGIGGKRRNKLNGSFYAMDGWRW